jgi:hypothetical protein
VHAITRYAPAGDKQMRLYAQTATIENGFVYLPREAPWLADYLRELTAFPYSKYDDQVDSTSQALDWIKRASRSSNVLNYNWRELALERITGATPPRRSPPNWECRWRWSKGGSMKSGKRRRKRALPCWRCGSAPTSSSAPSAARSSDTTFRSAGGEVATITPSAIRKCSPNRYRISVHSDAEYPASGPVLSRSGDHVGAARSACVVRALDVSPRED